MMDLWQMLGTKSRRALMRRRGRFGHPYTYSPRGDLIDRIAEEGGVTREQAFQALMELRQEVLLERPDL